MRLSDAIVQVARDAFSCTYAVGGRQLRQEHLRVERDKNEPRAVRSELVDLHAHDGSLDHPPPVEYELMSRVAGEGGGGRGVGAGVKARVGACVCVCVCVCACV